MAKRLQTKYREAVHRALERCQFIEETLRVYLDLVIQIAKIELSPHFPVNISKEDLSKFPLGKLVNEFSRFSGDRSLRARLKEVTPARNHVAHQSLLFTLGELQDDAHLSKLISQMNEFEKRAKEAHESLLDERWKLHKSLAALRRRGNRNAKA